MLISIIVPVFNAENSIENCVSSLLAALPEEGEIILVDDGSKDDSADICDMLSQKYKHVRTIHQSNSGPGIARNRGIEEARGEYLLFCDVDDWVEKTIAKKMVGMAKEHRVDIVICGNYVHRDNQKDQIQQYANELVSSKEEARKKLFFVGKAPWSKLYRREIIEKNSIRFPNQKRVQDAIFNLEYFDNINSCYTTSDILYHYNANTGTSLAKKFTYEVFQMYMNAVRLMYEKTEKWGIDDSAIEKKIGMFMLLAVDKCITALIYRDTDKKTRYEIINSIIHDVTVRNSLERFAPSSIYYKMLKQMMKIGNRKLIYNFVKVKLKLVVMFK